MTSCREGIFIIHFVPNILDEYFRWAEYAAMLVNFRLPEGLGQTLLCIVTVFFNKVFMIYRRKCNRALTCKCTGIALDLPVGLSIIGAT